MTSGIEMTKADTLLCIKNDIKEVNILPIFVLESNRYFADKNKTVKAIVEFAQGRKVVVRSSSSKEDGELYSNAGRFDSILNVSPNDNELFNAIELVYSSYQTNDNEQILIQPMLTEIKYSGVVFTSDMDTLAPYYIVNYSVSGNSAAVTGGEEADLQTYVEYSDTSIKSKDIAIKKLLEDCKKLQKYFRKEALDIEFATDYSNNVFILQVRPIAKGKKSFKEPLELKEPLKRIYKKVEKLSKPHPFLLGKTTIFGVMPDWNPAEILGARPRKLAISLYKELITDSVWAHQRYNYGYRDLTMHPLMISFCGIPYIDTRITFNSFIPRNLNEDIAKKLVDYYIDKLRRYPRYHDKVEFEIVFSCYYLGLSNDLDELKKAGFSDNELKRIEFALLNLTNDIINPQKSMYKADIEKAKVLEMNFERIMSSDISLVDKIYWLIEECKEYGTLPFAGVARAAFIAVQFLKSFVKLGIIRKDEYDLFMNSLDTINKKMNCSVKKMSNGEISKDDFLEMYGHIRPGTYDILTNRYDEAFDEYFGEKKSMFADLEQSSFCFSDEQMSKMQYELDQNGLLITSEELICFMREAIEGREQLKFMFTKYVSEILRLIEKLGIRNGLDKEAMSHADISIIKQLYVDLYTGDIKTMLQKNIEDNKRQYECALRIKLPALITSPSDIYSFSLLKDEPNFITQKSIIGEICVIKENEEYDLEGKIVFIKSADPGYDFIFSKKIGGLVTQFGGANSHMAIRCAELGIPAIIGAGEINYNEWSKQNSIEIDCLNKKVRVSR